MCGFLLVSCQNLIVQKGDPLSSLVGRSIEILEFSKNPTRACPDPTKTRETDRN